MAFDIKIDKLHIGKRKLIDEPIQINIRPGKITSISGPNGSGKSVLMTCLAGWTSHYNNIMWRGNIAINGQSYDIPYDLSKYNNYSKQNISFLSHQLFEESLGVTLEEELNLISAQFKADMPQCVKIFFDDLKSSHDPFIRMDYMSSGQKQLIALIDVISRGPRLCALLLDEPTSYLNDVFLSNMVNILEWLLVENPSCFIVMATHDNRLKKLIDNDFILPHKNSTPEYSMPHLENSLMKYNPGSIGISIQGRPIFNYKKLLFQYEAAIDTNASLILTGPNGSGKSIFLMSVGALCKVSGKLSYWKENNAVKIKKKDLYPQMLGFQFQEPVAYEFRERVCDLLVPPPWKTDKEKKYLMGFYEKILDMYDIDPQQNPRTLSSGQIKIIWIISQLGWASRWLLDEPDASLDTFSLALMKAIIFFHTEMGGTFIIATHNISMFKGIECNEITFDKKVC